VVAPSAYLARAAAELGIPARVIRNIVDPERCAFRRRRTLAPRLFWMRAFHDLYAPDLAVRVLARVRSSRPDATLVMAGPDKGTEQATRRLGESLQLDGALRFVGFLDSEGKAREAGRADVFLNTARVDNQPVAVLEAAAFGLPIVATAVGGVPDLLEHESTALLVPEDAEQMARAVERLLEDPDLAERLSAQGRLLAEQSAPARVVGEWRGLLEGPGAN
jgi:glycosyltransferase involved in cell wall biosynthesis